MSGDIFVFIEQSDGRPRKSSYELLSKAYEVSQMVSSTTYAIVLGGDKDRIVDALKGFATKIIMVNGEGIEEYRWDTYTSAIAGLINRYKPYMIWGASTIIGKDLFPRISARFGSPLISDATGIGHEDGQLKIRKPIYGGRIISWLTFKDNTMPMITFRPHSFAIEDRGLEPEVIEEAPDIKMETRMDVIGIERQDTRKIDLQEADFIICGGRGMKGPEHFKMLEDIADIMDGRVGASRAAVDNKWRPYEDQIGKSGKTVSPKLYIGCGVSGALHHIMGMDTSKVIVAINQDPEAPIFQYADYGIVDDLFNIIPYLKEELKRALGEG